MPQPSMNTSAAVAAPEIELLLCCARSRLEPATTERIKVLLREDIAWSFLLRIAHQHGVVPLLYRSLRATGADVVPRTILAQLQDQFQSNARRNILLARELLRLLNVFELDRIPALSLKGPVLATSVYRDLALRQFADLDILIHRRDVSRATELLIAQGYRWHHQNKRTSAQETAFRHLRHEFSFVDCEGKISVDLHWDILDKRFSFPVDLDRLWERLEPVSLMGTTVFNFSPEDLLLMLCVHGSKPTHRWFRLGWICDVAGLARVRPELDWELVMARAARLGSERRLLLGLGLASDLLATAIPPEVRQRIQADPAVEWLTAQVRKHLFCETETPPRALARFLFDFRVLERPGDRARFCLRFVLIKSVIRWALRPPVGLLSFPYDLLDRTQSRQVWIWPLPLFAVLSFLYHLLLPIRRTAKYGLSLFQHLRKRLKTQAV